MVTRHRLPSKSHYLCLHNGAAPPPNTVQYELHRETTLKITYTKTPKRRTRMPISRAKARMFFLRSGGDMFMLVQTLLQESDKNKGKQETS